MLPSSLKTPASSTLLSSEALNVVTPAAHSVAAAESVSENEIERDGEEDDNDSDNDLQIVGEQSCTVDSTGASSAGTEAPAKKAKITLTEEQERFAKQFHPAASKIDQTRKIPTRHVSGRGASIKKQGTPCDFMRETYSDLHLEIIKVSLDNNIIVKNLSLKVSLIAVNVIDYHFHLLQ